MYLQSSLTNNNQLERKTDTEAHALTLRANKYVYIKSILFSTFKMKTELNRDISIDSIGKAKKVDIM